MDRWSPPSSPAALHRGVGVGTERADSRGADVRYYTVVTCGRRVGQWCVSPTASSPSSRGTPRRRRSRAPDRSSRRAWISPTAAALHAAIHGQFERDIAEEVDESDCKTDRRRNPPECEYRIPIVTRASAHDRFSPILLSSHENGGNPMLRPRSDRPSGRFRRHWCRHRTVPSSATESRTRTASLRRGRRRTSRGPRSESGYRVPSPRTRFATDATSTLSRLVAGVVANVISTSLASAYSSPAVNSIRSVEESYTA